MMIENGPAIACHYRIIVPPKERFAWSTSPFITPHAPSSLSPPTYTNTYDNATLLHLFLLFLAKHLNITRQLSQKRIRITNTGLRTFLNLRKLNHGKKKKMTEHFVVCCGEAFHIDKICHIYGYSFKHENNKFYTKMWQDI